MCSRHEHVQAVVARLNAGEHISEVKLGGVLLITFSLCGGLLRFPAASLMSCCGE